MIRVEFLSREGYRISGRIQMRDRKEQKQKERKLRRSSLMAVPVLAALLIVGCGNTGDGIYATAGHTDERNADGAFVDAGSAYTSGEAGAPVDAEGQDSHTTPVGMAAQEREDPSLGADGQEAEAQSAKADAGEEEGRSAEADALEGEIQSADNERQPETDCEDGYDRGEGQAKTEENADLEAVGQDESSTDQAGADEWRVVYAGIIAALEAKGSGVCIIDPNSPDGHRCGYDYRLFCVPGDTVPRLYYCSVVSGLGEGICRYTENGVKEVVPGAGLEGSFSGSEQILCEGTADELLFYLNQ